MRVYTLRRQIVNPGAVTVLQVRAATTRPIAVVRAWVSQIASTTSGQTSVVLVRKATPATVTAFVAGDVIRQDPSDPAASIQLGTAASGHTATAEGADGDITLADGFNVLNGWLYLPLPEERGVIPADGTMGLKFRAAPPAGTYEVGLRFIEVA